MRMPKFVSAVVAGSIALTAGFSAPAAAGADSEQLARILLGAVAVGAIAHQVNKNSRSRETVVHHNDYQSYRPRVEHHNHRPKTCLRRKYTGHGWKTFYSSRCLEQHRHRRNGHNANARFDNHDHKHSHKNRKHQRHGSHDRHHDRDGFFNDSRFKDRWVNPQNRGEGKR